MNTNFRHFTRSAVALATAALLAACGGGEATPPPDLVPPTVVITDNVAAASTNGPVTFSFAFSESVGTSFIADDVVVSGGTKGAFTMAADGKSATLVVTPTANASGTMKVDLAAGVFKDLAGNMSTAAYSGSQDYSTVVAPTVAAALPPSRNAADVLSIYSDAYAQIAGVNLRPDWGQTTAVSEVLIAANKTEKYTALNYEGIEFAAINVSAMTKLHIDVWTPDVTSLKLSIISAGKESAVTLTPTLAGWNSFDIDLAQYTVQDKTAIIQVKMEGTPTGGTLYFDNLYFWKPATVVQACGTVAPTCAPTTTIAAGAVTIYSETAAVAGFDAFPNWGQSTTFSEANIAGNKSLKYGFGATTSYQGLDWSANPVNVSAKANLHLDFWTPDLSSVKVSIISAGKENAFTQSLTAGSWNSVDIPLSNYTANLGAIIQIKLETTTAGTLYVDNIYFGGSGGVVTPPAVAPTNAPTPPSVAAANVKSLYSEAYTTTGGFDIPNWGQSQIVSDVTVAGNKVLMGDRFTYQGFQFDALNATTLGLTFLHIDIWSADATPVKAYIISAGQDTESVDIVPTAGAWKGVDIPLSSFTKINKSAVFQVKLDTTIQPTTKVMYFDNLYFWK